MIIYLHCLNYTVMYNYCTCFLEYAVFQQMNHLATFDKGIQTLLAHKTFMEPAYCICTLYNYRPSFLPQGSASGPFN